MIRWSWYQRVVITWDTTPAAQKQYNEKIEFCPGAPFLPGQKCIVLAANTANDGLEAVTVPKSLKPGTGQIRLTARDKKSGQLIPRLAMTRTARALRVASRSSDGGGGGGGSGGGGGDGGGSTGGGSGESVPSADFVSPVDNEVVTADADLDVRVKLIETTTQKLTCQQWTFDGQPLLTSDWVEGQSPDLSAGACQ